MSDTTAPEYGRSAEDAAIAAEVAKRDRSQTPCGPLCDQQHMVSEPHNRNRAPVQPQDHQAKGNPQRDEAEDREVTFPWDGEEWTFNTAAATSLEFLAALDDAESDEDPLGMVRAARILLGRDQATRLFKGRQVTDIFDFFTVAGEAGGTGNR